MKHLSMLLFLLLLAASASSCISLRTTHNAPPRQQALFVHPSPQEASAYIAAPAGHSDR